MDFVKVAEIINTFGIKGELKCRSLSDFVEERFKPGQVLYLEHEGRKLPVTVQQHRLHQGFLLVKLKEYDNINQVEGFKEDLLYIAKDQIAPLKEGEYYFFELVGCSVYADQQFIGEVIAMESGYQNILRIKGQNREILVPYVKAFIEKVDVEKRRIDIHAIGGML